MVEPGGHAPQGIRICLGKPRVLLPSSLGGKKLFAYLGKNPQRKTAGPRRKEISNLFLVASICTRTGNLLCMHKHMNFYPAHHHTLLLSPKTAHVVQPRCKRRIWCHPRQTPGPYPLHLHNRPTFPPSVNRPPAIEEKNSRTSGRVDSSPSAAILATSMCPTSVQARASPGPGKEKDRPSKRTTPRRHENIVRSMYFYVWCCRWSV